MAEPARSKGRTISAGHFHIRSCAYHAVDNGHYSLCITIKWPHDEKAFCSATLVHKGPFEHHRFIVNAHGNIKQVYIKDVVVISGKSAADVGFSRIAWKEETTWNEIFSILGPDLFTHQSEYACQRVIAQYFVNKAGRGPHDPNLDDHSKKIIKIQFLALGLIKLIDLPLKSGDSGQFWKITDAGKTALMQVMSIKRST